MIHKLLARAFPLALLLALGPLASAAPDVGDPLPRPGFDELKQTAAKSFEDFTGRVLLIEFFEYW
ncbi:hypothetical protein Poly30_07590 [Planctomycetes bacterium Poly30]|uniref:Redoxin domain-containing protein n=1 Tax=Saltatorellus ferox TaxID=2528018 RepID=A0A518EMF3_9BACT|nr:hypothetical protein Poly30_07590 [Planctomycetes bacterium Poly30]